MLLALEFFLVGKLLACGHDAVLCLDMRRVRPGRSGAGIRWRALKSAAYPADLQAGRKAFEIALLLVAEVDGESIDFHGLRRSSCCHSWLNGLGLAAPKSRDFRMRSDQPRCCGNPSWTRPGHPRRLAALQHSSCVPAGESL